MVVQHVQLATGSYQAPVWVIAAMVLIAAFLFTRVDPTRPLIAEDRYISTLLV